MRSWAWAALIAAAIPGEGRAAPPSYDELLNDSCQARQETAKQATPEQRAALIDSLTDRQLIELGKRSLCGLGEVYRFQIKKQERVRGKLLKPQTLSAIVREVPFAARMEVLEGPSQGMKVLYNVQLRTGDLRAREGGLLGLLAVWVDIHGRLALNDTNHCITDLGIGGVIRNLEKEQPRSDAAGVKRVPAGWDAEGRYCVDFVAPPGARDVYAHKTHLCLDTELGLPMSTVSTDEQGATIETVEISHLEPAVKVPADTFTLAGAGL